MRLTAIARSSGVKNQAFVGESGKKNLSGYKRLATDTKSIAAIHQYAKETTKVREPVIIISHCHGAKPPVWIWSVPKLIKPEIIWAV